MTTATQLVCPFPRLTTYTVCSCTSGRMILLYVNLIMPMPWTKQVWEFPSHSESNAKNFRAYRSNKLCPRLSLWSLFCGSSFPPAALATLVLHSNDLSAYCSHCLDALPPGFHMACTQLHSDLYLVTLPQSPYQPA